MDATDVELRARAEIVRREARSAVRRSRQAAEEAAELARRAARSYEQLGIVFADVRHPRAVARDRHIDHLS